MVRRIHALPTIGPTLDWVGPLPNRLVYAELCDSMDLLIGTLRTSTRHGPGFGAPGR